MPPKPKAVLSTRRTIGQQLHEALLASGLTAYAIGRQAEVDPGMIQRFLNGDRGLSLETVNRLGLALGLRLVEGGRTRGRPSRPSGGHAGKAIGPGIAHPDAPSTRPDETPDSIPACVPSDTVVADPDPPSFSMPSGLEVEASAGQVEPPPESSTDDPAEVEAEDDSWPIY